jgi:hypothetical protein
VRGKGEMILIINKELMGGVDNFNNELIWTVRGKRGVDNLNNI